MSTKPSMPKIQLINNDVTTKEGWRNIILEECATFGKRARNREFQLMRVDLFTLRHPVSGDELNSKIARILLATRFNSPTDDDSEIEYQKEHFARIVRCHALIGEAIGSLAFSEIWRSHRREGDPRIQPRHDPKREEALMIASNHRDHGAGMHSAIIHPIQNKTKRRIGDWVHDYAESGHELTGRMVDFIPPVPPDAERRRHAVIAAKSVLAMNYENLEYFEGNNNAVG